MGRHGSCRVVMRNPWSMTLAVRRESLASQQVRFQRALFFNGTTFSSVGTKRHLEQIAQEHPIVLAQMNYARLLVPLDDPKMKEFQLALEPINLIAKSTPGFVWSYDNDDEAEHLAVDLLREDPLLMPQLSLWQNMAALRHFVFKSGHAMYFKRKKEWFTSPPSPYSVCWWHDLRASDYQPPSLKESFHRCAHLKEHGPTEYAFDFGSAEQFPAPVHNQ